jgi:hypothetical protein
VVCSSDGPHDIICPSLLWYVVATGGWDVTVLVATKSHSRKGNPTSDDQLLLDRFKFIHTCRHSQIQFYQGIIIRHIDRNWLNTSSNTCSHRQVFIIEHHTCFIHNTTFQCTSWYIYWHPQCLKFLLSFHPSVLVLAVCNRIAQETGSCDHQEYGTFHVAIYIHAWGSDKVMMELSEVLHLTSAPMILQVPR